MWASSASLSESEKRVRACFTGGAAVANITASPLSSTSYAVPALGPLAALSAPAYEGCAARALDVAHFEDYGGLAYLPLWYPLRAATVEPGAMLRRS